MFDLVDCRGISAVTNKMVRASLVMRGPEETRKLLTALAEMEISRKMCVATSTNKEEASFLKWASEVHNHKNK